MDGNGDNIKNNKNNKKNVNIEFDKNNFQSLQKTNLLLTPDSDSDSDYESKIQTKYKKTENRPNQITDFSDKKFNVNILKDIKSNTTILKLNNAGLTDSDLIQLSNFLLSNRNKFKFDGIQMKNNKLSDNA